MHERFLRRQTASQQKESPAARGDKIFRKRDVEEWCTGGQSSGRKPGGQAWTRREADRQMQDTESRLQQHLNRGRSKGQSVGLKMEDGAHDRDFDSAQTLADAVRKELGELPSARIVNPLQLALID